MNMAYKDDSVLSSWGRSSPQNHTLFIILNKLSIVKTFKYILLIMNNIVLI